MGRDITMNVREFLASNSTQDERTFGIFLRQRREELGLTLRELASKLQVTAAYLSDIEKGNRRAPINYIGELCIALEISEEERVLFEDLANITHKMACPDMEPYLRNKEIARVALRKARDRDISDEKWAEILRIIDES